MGQIRVANAPVSWGAIAFTGFNEDPLGYETVMNEIAETGYAGTELGDYGFYPTDPDELRAALAKRDLTLLGAYVGNRLRDAGAFDEDLQNVLTVARLLAAVDPEADRRNGPFLVIADANGADPMRSLNAGRITPEMSLPDAEWPGYARRAEAIARAVRDETGLRAVFHPHSAGWVETPWEVDRLLAETDPEVLGIIFDTGHYSFGAGDDGPTVIEVMDRWADRIWYIHFKDYSPEVGRRSRQERWEYVHAIRKGLFSELGQGGVDFPAVLRWLEAHGYDGWIVVEQDVLPGMGTPKESARRNREYLTSLGL